MIKEICTLAGHNGLSSFPSTVQQRKTLYIVKVKLNLFCLGKHVYINILDKNFRRISDRYLGYPKKYVDWIHKCSKSYIPIQVIWKIIISSSPKHIQMCIMSNHCVTIPSGRWRRCTFQQMLSGYTRPSVESIKMVSTYWHRMERRIKDTFKHL